MRLRTFTASDMNAAMQQVRDSIGNDAVIIATGKIKGGVSVTVALESAEEPKVIQMASSPTHAFSQTLLPPEQERFLHDIAQVFTFHGVPKYLFEKFMDTARYLAGDQPEPPEDMSPILLSVIKASFQFAPLALEKAGLRIMLVGPPGIGKTVTIAKMATQMVMKKRSVKIITTDTKHAGGIEQISSLTDILGVPLSVAQNRKELKSLLKDCTPNDRVLIDSAGANPYDYQELKELGEFAGISEVEPVLVAAAGGDAGEAEEITRAFSFLGPRKLLVTRADTARRFGSVLTTASLGELALCQISRSAKVAEPLEDMSAKLLYTLLTKYQQEL